MTLIDALIVQQKIIDAQNSHTKNARKFLRVMRMLDKIKFYGAIGKIDEFAKNILENLDSIQTTKGLPAFVNSLKRLLPPGGKILEMGETPNAPRFHYVSSRGPKPNKANIEAAQKIYAIQCEEGLSYPQARNQYWQSLSEDERVHWLWDINKFRRAMDVEFGVKKRTQ